MWDMHGTYTYVMWYTHTHTHTLLTPIVRVKKMAKKEKEQKLGDLHGIVLAFWNDVYHKTHQYDVKLCCDMVEYMIFLVFVVHATFFLLYLSSLDFHFIFMIISSALNTNSQTVNITILPMQFCPQFWVSDWLTEFDGFVVGVLFVECSLHGCCVLVCCALLTTIVIFVMLNHSYRTYNQFRLSGKHGTLLSLRWMLRL